MITDKMKTFIYILHIVSDNFQSLFKGRKIHAREKRKIKRPG